VGDRGLQLVLPAGHHLAVALHHRLEALAGDIRRVRPFRVPTLVSIMSARSKNSVSGGPRHRVQVT